MQEDSLKKLSVIIALILSLVSAGVCLLAMWSFESKPNALVPISVFLLTFLSGFFLVNSFLENFIYSKIKLIYRTINQFKSIDDAKKKIDPVVSLERVKHEVEQWGKARSEEIEEYKKREAFRREFIGNLAHELKTPIFNIQGYVFTLLDGAVDDPKYAVPYLQRTERSVERLISLVKDLDQISKLESGALQLEKKPTNLVDLVNESMDSYSEQANAKGIKLILAKPQDRVMAHIDPQRIRQVFDNLISNGIKYGKEEGKVEIDFLKIDKAIHVEVSNDGPGIDAKHLPRLFERFYRIDHSRNREIGGSGLGLAIVKHIVEAHGSSITVTSDQETGTVFTFNLEKV